MRDPGRIARGIAGVVVLVLIFVLVNGWWRQYRQPESSEAPSAETTATVEPETEGEKPEGAPEGEKAQEASGSSVVVLIEGLNFRKEPSREGELIRGLARGTRLVHLTTQDGWHHVKDDKGVEGYVSASPQYTEVQQ